METTKVNSKHLGGFNRMKPCPQSTVTEASSFLQNILQYICSHIREQSSIIKSNCSCERTKSIL